MVLLRGAGWGLEELYPINPKPSYEISRIWASWQSQGSRLGNFGYGNKGLDKPGVKAAIGTNRLWGVIL